MSTTPTATYGNPTLFEKIGVIISVVFHLPLTLTYTLLTANTHPANKHKPAARIIAIAATHHLTARLNARQIQWALSSTRAMYESYMRKHDLPTAVDELGHGARLLWMGNRNAERVILYFHGGAYLFPIFGSTFRFWEYIQSELKGTHGKDVSIAFLNYSLLPTATFQTQLTQAVLSLHHLTSTLSLPPSSIHLAGDSAGANLTLALLSYLLHPVSLPAAPTLHLSMPLAGAYVMSPWASLSSPSTSGSMAANTISDVLNIQCLPYWSTLVLTPLPTSLRNHIEPAHVPPGWFNGLDRYVTRVLITAGERECLRDAIGQCARALEEGHERVEYVVQKGGVHNDPFLDFVVGKGPQVDKKGEEVTSVILRWFAAGL